MKKVYGYIRVSTARQGEGVSLIVQKEAITRYAAQYNLDITKWFEEKETAAKQGRPLFTAMLKLLKAGKADGVIIHKIDRSARNLKDWADLGGMIDEGIDVHFAHESLDLQARGGRLSADIQAVIAADYIRNLRQEAIKGIYGRLEQGVYPFQAPTGYKDNGAGKYKTIDDVQGPLVRQAFELYSTGKFNLDSLTELMRGLGLRNVRKNCITVNGMSSILNNTFYMGVIKVKGHNYMGGHEPLVTPSLFQGVQRILRGKTNQKVRKIEYKLRKLIKCVCGYSLVPETQKGIIYYRCHVKDCPTKGLRESTIENLYLKEFQAMELHPDELATISELIEERQKNRAHVQRELLKAIKMQAQQVQQKLDRLTDCYLEGGLDKETYQKRKGDLLMQQKEKELMQNESNLGLDMIFEKLKRCIEIAKTPCSTYFRMRLEEQREFVKSVTSNLVLEGKQLVISMRSPFFELANRAKFQSGGARKGITRFMDVRIDTLPTSEKSDSVPLNREELTALLDSLIQIIGEKPEDYINN